MSYAQHRAPVLLMAYNLAHAFQAAGKRGVEALAPHIRKHPHVLNNEINPDYHDTKLGIMSACLIDVETQRFDILHAHAREHHHVCFPIHGADCLCGDMELLAKLSEWKTAVGITCQCIHGAIDPARVNGKGIRNSEAQEIRAFRHHTHVEIHGIF